MTADLALIRGLEERAFNAWPAPQTVLCGGWVVRMADGYTKRANSANALTPDTPLADLEPMIRALYERRGLPVVFRLTPLAGTAADAVLDGLGYRAMDPSLVMTAALDGLMPVDAIPGADTVMAAAVTPAWLEGYTAANRLSAAQRAAHGRILDTLTLPAAFATVYRDGQAVAYGLGVYERGMVGLFDIVVLPEARRRGYGGVLTRALMQWGRSQGAEQAYLQVTEINDAARRLYAAHGFREAYRYHYRVQPPQA